MGLARLHRLAGDDRRGLRRPPVDHPGREPLKCSVCETEMAGRGGSGTCARCTEKVLRVATTGSPNRRLINQPSRHARRAKKAATRSTRHSAGYRHGVIARPPARVGSSVDDKDEAADAPTGVVPANPRPDQPQSPTNGSHLRKGKPS